MRGGRKAIWEPSTVAQGERHQRRADRVLCQVFVLGQQEADDGLPIVGLADLALHEGVESLVLLGRGGQLEPQIAKAIWEYRFVVAVDGPLADLIAEHVLRVQAADSRMRRQAGRPRRPGGDRRRPQHRRTRGLSSHP